LNKKKVSSFEYSKYEKNIMIGIDSSAKTLVRAVESALKLADPDKNFATLVFSYSGSQ
jgi:hypothetical protein